METKLDAIIFGATGFTGKIVVENAPEVLQGLTWGIAGRNSAKLENVLKGASKKIGKDLSQIPIILAEVEDENSIREMASRCKVIINCCGPYRFYGEVVVEACIQAGTHYVDISGEPQFIDGMALRYHELAKEKRSYVISACGFGSLPAEMGIVFAERNFPGTVNSIEMYWENTIDFKEGESKALLHAGTWESVVKQLITFKQQLMPKDYPELRPALKVISYPHKVPTLESYFIPLKGGDGDIVANTQRLWFENTIQFQKYVGYKSLLYAILTPILVFLISLLSQLSFTRSLLLKNPKIFTLGLISSESPTEATMESHCFNLLFKSKGWTKQQSLSEQPKQQLWTRVSGRNPFYAMTGVTLLAAARIILQETDKLPGSGGVISPGYAFAKTSMIEDLQKYKYGIKFEVLKLES